MGAADFVDRQPCRQGRQAAAAAAMIEFKYSEPDWGEIKAVVRDVLGLDADRIVVESTRMDGTPHGVRLRTKIEGTAQVHLARDAALRKLPTQLALRKHLTVIRKDAERLWDGIDESRLFWASHNDYAPEKEMLEATDVYFEKLLRNLDGIIAALGPPRKKTGSAASRNMGRDLFWSDELSIWYKIGGRKTGVDAADFLIAVSTPVFRAMPRGARSAVPERLSVIQWLRRQSPKGSQG
jgi:hypothetical protein